VPLAGRRFGLRARAIAMALGLGGAVLAAAPGAAAATPPALHAKSAAILNMENGALLWSENGRLRLPMASTTKLMTALVALDLLHDRTATEMTVPPEVSQAYGELLYLKPGETYTFLQLLQGMLLPSANDAAIAVAVDSAGSLPRFVALMNQEALALGLTDTHFANPDGLDDPDHYSSADDLARLGLAAMENPIIRRIVAEPQATIPAPSNPATTEVIGNIDALLAMYPGATGIKTGYTSEAMNVIVGSARHGSNAVIAVLMGEPAATLWTDEEHLLSYGFQLVGTGPAVSDHPASAAVAPRAAALVPALPAEPSAGAPGPSKAAPALVPNSGPARDRAAPRGDLFAAAGAGPWRWAWPVAAAVLLGAAAALRGRAVRRRRAARRRGFEVLARAAGGLGGATD
jgi:D-alanyl-D-alanine carboxypeptidase